MKFLQPASFAKYLNVKVVLISEFVVLKNKNEFYNFLN